VDAGVRSPIRVIPNGINLSRFSTTEQDRIEAREHIGLKGSEPVVLSVGQIQPRKGVDIFLKCARSLPDTKFIWVGDFLFGAASAERRTLRRMIEEATPNVKFTGQLSRDRVLTFYRAADVFMLASRHETFGLAPLEAGASGTPMVLSDLAVFRETLGHVNDAYLSASGPEEFVESIRRLLANRMFRKRTGALACQAAARYDSASVAEMTRAAYLSVKRWP
jgi:1,2-diacylglycerol-3-alpha-glucose alpha-1,2-galactosyltransferase